MTPAKKTPDGREILVLYMHGYEYHIVESLPRNLGGNKELNMPQPCFMGHHNFGLRYCKKISKYKKSLLNFQIT